MKKITCLFTLCFLLFIGSSYAQFGAGAKLKLVSGDVKILKSEKEYNLQYEYDGLKVGGVDEEDYLNEQVKKKNDKEAGSGDKFKTEWFANREKKFEPKFEELLNKDLSEVGAKASKDNKKAKYTIIVKTDYIEPGFNVGVMKKPSYINITIKIVETANPSNVIAKIMLTQVPGMSAMGMDFDTGTRISESYAKAGKELGHYLLKNAYGK
ncbi:MAG: hypothetical protein PHD97_04720 [Bacteroidales bacterium]|nr:hypothetical protein [Bacteroidales bacterium]